MYERVELALPCHDVGDLPHDSVGLRIVEGFSMRGGVTRDVNDGVCRQLLLDYAPSIEVIVRDGDRLRRASIAELMPLAHRSWFADDV